MITDLIENAAQQFPNKIAIIYKHQEITYWDLLQQIKQCAQALKKLGVHPGDRVAFFLHDNPEKIIMYFACFHIGAIAVPLYFGLRGQDLEHVIHLTTPQCIITESPLFDFIKNQPNVVLWQNLSAQFSESAEALQLDETILATIFFSSGTTAKPKGIVHNQEHHRHQCLAMAKAQAITPSDCMLCYGMDFSATFTTRVFPTLAVGATVFLPATFEPAVIFDALRKHKITLLGATPSLIRSITELANHTDRFSHHLRLCTVGGDTCLPPLFDDFEKAFKIPLTNIIGMTELFAYAMAPPNRPDKRYSNGLPFPGVQIRIEHDEILLQSHTMMLGYWQDPKHTQEVLHDGWLRSGDIGSIDEEGFLWFKSRHKHIIIIDGDNVAPAEVEHVLNQHPQVNHSAVIGVPDVDAEEVIAAFIVLQKNVEGKVTAESIQQFVRSQLADYKIPKFVYFIEELPKNNRGKLDRLTLKKMHESFHQPQ